MFLQLVMRLVKLIGRFVHALSRLHSSPVYVRPSHSSQPLQLMPCPSGATYLSWVPAKSLESESSAIGKTKPMSSSTTSSAASKPARCYAALSSTSLWQMHCLYDILAVGQSKSAWSQEREQELHWLLAGSRDACLTNSPD